MKNIYLLQDSKNGEIHQWCCTDEESKIPQLAIKYLNDIYGEGFITDNDCHVKKKHLISLEEISLEVIKEVDDEENGQGIIFRELFFIVIVPLI